jgi:hypothetical protein
LHLCWHAAGDNPRQCEAVASIGSE